MTMIATISQPIWILVSVIGLADICLFWWCIALMRNARKANRRVMERETGGPPPEQGIASHSFQTNLVDLQIDAVFDGLAALIETERIKLKSLILPVGAQMIADTASKRPEHGAVVEQCNFQDDPEATIEQQVAAFAAAGKNRAVIASQLGLSFAEVDLAMKLQANSKTPAGMKLEAVA